MSSFGDKINVPLLHLKTFHLERRRNSIDHHFTLDNCLLYFSDHGRRDPEKV